MFRRRNFRNGIPSAIQLKAEIPCPGAVSAYAIREIPASGLKKVAKIPFLRGKPNSRTPFYPQSPEFVEKSDGAYHFRLRFSVFIDDFRLLHDNLSMKVGNLEPQVKTLTLKFFAGICRTRRVFLRQRQIAKPGVPAGFARKKKMDGSMKNSRIKFCPTGFVRPVSCVALLAFLGCHNPTEPPQTPPKPAVPKTVSVSFVGVSQPARGRTILPQWPLNEESLEYSLELVSVYPPVPNPPARENWEAGKTIDLTVGTWKVILTAFLHINGTRTEVARGEKTIEVTESPSQIHEITVSPIKNGDHPGSFVWNVSFPANLEDARMTFEPFSDGSIVPPPEPVVFRDPQLGGVANGIRFEANGVTGLPSGEYLVRFIFEKRNEYPNEPPPMVVISHALHIYAGTETVPFTLEITDGDFPRSLLEIILKAWDDDPGRWNLAGHKIRGGHFALLGIGGVEYDFLDAEPGIGLNSWFNKLVEDAGKHGIGDRKGLSVLVDAALIGLGIDSAFIQNHNKRRDVFESVKALAGNGNEPKMSWDLDGNGNSVLKVEVGPYGFDVPFDKPMQDFDVRFHGNGGFGNLATGNGYDGVPFVLPDAKTAAAFSRQWWWHPAGWNRAPGGDDKNPDFAFGASFTRNPQDPTDEVNLYLAWGRGEATLSFDLNGGNGMKPADKKYKMGDGIPLPSGGNRQDHLFLGWGENPASESVEPAGSRHLLTKNATLYAIWERHPSNEPPPRTVSVTFIANNGTQDSVTVKARENGVITLPTSGEFKREGHNFTGWILDGNAGKLLPSRSPFALGKTDAVFRAQWAKWETAPFRTITLRSENPTVSSVALEPVPGGTVITLPSVGFTWRFRDLVGWDTKKLIGDGERPNPTFQLNDPYTVSNDAILHAAWFRPEWTVEFKSEHLSNDFPPKSALNGDSVKLYDYVEFRHPGTQQDLRLVSWVQNTGTTEHRHTPGDNFQPTENIVLTAQWDDVSVKGITVTGPKSIERGKTGIFTATLMGGLKYGDVEWKIVSDVISPDETGISRSRGSTDFTSIGTLTVGLGEGGQNSNLFDFENGGGEMVLRAFETGNPEKVYGEIRINLTGARKAGEWRIVRIGQDQTFAITWDGQLWGWGRNANGQTGTGGKENQFLPKRIGNNSDWEDVTGALYHGLAIRSGELYAWGLTDSGRLGIGSTTAEYISDPTRVGMDNDWMSLGVGREASYGIKRGGKLYAWGKNNQGQLGIGNTDNQPAPVEVGNATQRAQADWRFKAVAGGFDFAAAIKEDGTLWTWGGNGAGRLGRGTVGASDPVPGCINFPDAKFSAIAVGSGYVVAIGVDGNIYVFGDTGSGRTGGGTQMRGTGAGGFGNNEIYQIKHPKSSSGVKWASAGTTSGSGSIMAIDSDYRLWVWGSNDKAQLGLGNPNVAGSLISQIAQPMPNAKWIYSSSGGWFSLAIQADGSLWAWGEAMFGQLGVGEKTEIDKLPTYGANGTSGSTRIQEVPKRVVKPVR